MPLVPMKEMLISARAEGYAVGAFTVWGIESAQAVIAAAEELNRPVILQIGTVEIEYAGVGALANVVCYHARNAKVPVAFNLDHGDTFARAEQCISAGATSVMLDASHLPFEQNVAATRDVVQLAAGHGVSVEGELGRIGGQESADEVMANDAHLTDPDQAADYVAQTGIDVLAIGIGTVHGAYKTKPNIRLDVLEKIARNVSIPLVLHGGSGTPDDIVRQAISLGIAKINICTEFVTAFAQRFVSQHEDSDFRYWVPGIMEKPRAAAKELAAAKIRLFAGI